MSLDNLPGSAPTRSATASTVRTTTCAASASGSTAASFTTRTLPASFESSCRGGCLCTGGDVPDRHGGPDRPRLGQPRP
jgi:hypothetical protein